jgi:uncharacterized protein (TIGR02231 family)
MDTKITAVTVYLDRALIVRKGKIQLTGEETELIVPELPLSLNTNSVRVAGRGTTRVKLLAVRTETDFSNEPVNQEIARLQAEIETLEEQKRTSKDRIEAVRLQNKFVQTLSEKSAERFSLALAKQETNIGQTEELLNFLGDRYLNYADRLTSLEKEEKEIDKNLSILRQQLKQIKNTPSDRSYRISIAIEPEGAGEFELEISYIVDNASWTPLYDLQLDSDRKALELNYLAEVNQNTGEDWQEISLILSTAQPRLGSLPPKLNPWYVDVYNPIPKQVARRSREVDLTQDMMLSAAPAGGSSDLNFDETFQEIAEVTNATVDRSGSVISFSVGGNNNIPSDRNPHKVTIFRDEYPSDWRYLAIPKLINFAYLQATITNPAEGVTFLPGEANIFRDNVFIGTTSLENIVPGETFKLDLGIEEKIKLERELVERQVDKKFLGDRRVINYAYRLKITNLLEQNIQIDLQEQLPVSRSEKIKVRLDRTNPKIEPKEMGILEWQLTLASQQKIEIYYQFIVEYPHNLTIIGLGI